MSARSELNGGFKSSHKKALLCENINIYSKKIIIAKGMTAVKTTCTLTVSIGSYASVLPPWLVFALKSQAIYHHKMAMERTSSLEFNVCYYDGLNSLQTSLNLAKPLQEFVYCRLTPFWISLHLFHIWKVGPSPHRHTHTRATRINNLQ